MEFEDGVALVSPTAIYTFTGLATSPPSRNIPTTKSTGTSPLTNR